MRSHTGGKVGDELFVLGAKLANLLQHDLRVVVGDLQDEVLVLVAKLDVVVLAHDIVVDTNAGRLQCAQRSGYRQHQPFR